MIPLKLRVAGFLSYREPVELDFTSLELACVSGANGAGKSTLLDAMTWALFGQARKRDESLVNLQSKSAEVTLTFRYESSIYRIQRGLTLGKGAVLEFQVLQSPNESASGAAEIWKALTERTVRETQARIERVLGLDYDTFVNASFFLQGKADQFAEQTPARRKGVLSTILGLETWETFKNRAVETRRLFEEQVATADARRAEIAAELAEDTSRRQRLASLQTELGRLGTTRKAQQAAVESVKRLAAAREQQQALVETLATALDRSRSNLATLTSRLSERESLRLADADLTRRKHDITSAYASWTQARLDVEQWERIASAFRKQEQNRLPLLEAITAEKARLDQEALGLLAEKNEIENQLAVIRQLEDELQAARQSLADADSRLADRARIESQLAEAQRRIAALRSENLVLKEEMDQLASRISSLNAVEGAACPLCGQPLTPQHRRNTLESVEAEGKVRGDRYRLNKADAEKLDLEIAELESGRRALASADIDQLARSNFVAQLSERLGSLQAVAQAWNSTGSGRLASVRAALGAGAYAVESQQELARLDKQLARLGYDAVSHDRARAREQELRPAEDEYHRLESALAALKPLENEIENLSADLANLRTENAAMEGRLQEAQDRLQAAVREAPDLVEAERALYDLQEQENRLNQELGAARQKVSVLEDLRVRDAELESMRQGFALLAGRHRVLERAFGKDGVPALLIEQALPEIEARANDLLDRLSDGRMSVHFVTQAGYKDRKREDFRETLEIQISDGVGVRDYEMYSGGEAFRINFAVRLALSQVLAARKGARLQTLVIDEGFASQDSQGRQRLIEAINMVRHDFALVLVITHLDELKDAFPARIEIEKTELGSRARIV